VGALERSSLEPLKPGVLQIFVPVYSNTVADVVYFDPRDNGMDAVVRNHVREMSSGDVSDCGCRRDIDKVEACVIVRRPRLAVLGAVERPDVPSAAGGV